MNAPDGEPVRDYWSAVKPARPRRPLPKSIRRRFARTRRRLVEIAAVILAAVTLTLLLRPAPPNSLPTELQGVWRTQASKYASRRFVIRSHILTFQVGEDQGSVTRHAIARVRTSRTPGGTLYRVTYYEDGDDSPELSFDFVFRNEGPPEIVILNQTDVVWRRVPGE
jgi:hypothetical protein